MNLIKAKVGEFSVGEAFATGVAKSLSERALTPVVGNGTWISGLIKMGLAYGTGKLMTTNRVGEKWSSVGKIEANALAVDGVEDIITDVSKRLNIGAKANSSYI